MSSINFVMVRANTPCPDKKGATRFFHNNFYKCALIFIIFGTRLCKWILIILLNLLCYLSYTSLAGWHNVDISDITWCMWNSHVAIEKNSRVRPPRDVATQFVRFESGAYSIWGILQERVYCLWIHDVKELKECLPREWKLLDHSIIVAVIAQWRTHLSACVRVNGGYFQHIFWTYVFLMCFVHFIDTGFCKSDRHEHVQSANIAWNVVTFMSETFTRYGSNVWQEILAPSTLAFSCEVVDENYENLSIFVKVTSKKPLYL